MNKSSCIVKKKLQLIQSTIIPEDSRTWMPEKIPRQREMKTLLRYFFIALSLWLITREILLIIGLCLNQILLQNSAGLQSGEHTFITIIHRGSGSYRANRESKDALGVFTNVCGCFIMGDFSGMCNLRITNVWQTIHSTHPRRNPVVLADITAATTNLLVHQLLSPYFKLWFYSTSSPGVCKLC